MIVCKEKSKRRYFILSMFPDSGKYFIISVLLVFQGFLLAENGVDYRVVTKRNPPLSVHIVSISLPLKDLRFAVSAGKKLKGKNTVPEMVNEIKLKDWVPIAAINGDYFEYKTEPIFFGTLQGLCVIDGELVSGPAGCHFFCSDVSGNICFKKAYADFQITWPDGTNRPFGLNCSTVDYKSEVKAAAVVLFTPRFGDSTGTKDVIELVLKNKGSKTWLPLKLNRVYIAEITDITACGNTAIPPDGLIISISKKAESEMPKVKKGDILQISTGIKGEVSDIFTAIGGDPLLLEAGKILPQPPGAGIVKMEERAPRTAIGFNSTNFFMVVVDGRQFFSAGMSHYELAVFMKELGCTDALNLDGGGSSVLWYNGKVMNSPSDSPLRAVGNTLILLKSGMTQ